MESLFNSEPLLLNLPDAEIIYYPQFFDKEQADTIYTELLQEIAWQQDNITVYGKTHPQPRLTALYGNEGKPYSYSNITMKPHPWNSLLKKIKYYIEATTECSFTTVLLNQYRDGKDSNGWHADNEKELGINPTIASLSFGAERVFQLKHNTIADAKKNIILEHGSLLLMKGSTQHFWKHQIPKTAKPMGARINLTFRTIK
ncbi:MULTISPECIES: alpha-ketoglutarate-dependent dioxygenase AlkB family protein [Flavobacterium]|uniref:Alpha-ketoglutarate-dependent dioxygenase AlkB n=1 Tax=Flavobacterium keumense TaxID=1306518 RepID=A0ABY8N1U0_9FLAO|nr:MULTISPECIES: alpha-ketoglutarate-dependent dioxygenase AlkB [Flavobacterium]WGK93620.1 alpha-ketoglutarate-dependent dioxygenase AlkB [Flavobacterium keumense]